MRSIISLNARCFSGLVLCFALLGCATEPALLPIQNNSSNVKAIGFELSQPHGNYWFYKPNNYPGWVTFRKQDPAKANLIKGDLLTFVIEVKAERYRDFDLLSPTGLESALKYALNENPDKFKYAAPKFEHYSWQETKCIRYTSTREETESFKGEPTKFHWEVEGFFCRHPHESHIAVTGLFQEVRAAETPSLLTDLLRKEANDVLNSVQFMRIK